MSRRPRRNVKWGTGVAIAAATALTISAPAARAQSPCDPANALRAAELLAEAESELQSLEGVEAADPCVDAGFEAIADARSDRAEALSQSLERDGVPKQTIDKLAPRIRSGSESSVPSEVPTEVEAGYGFAIARALKEAGYPGPAARVLKDAIVAEPKATVPEDLKALAAAAGVHLAAAEALAEAGLDEQATAELELAIKDDPDVEVPEQLLSPTRRPGWWSEVLAVGGPVLRTVIEIAISLLAAFAVAFLVSRLLGRREQRLYVQAFTGAKDDPAAAPTAAALQEQYTRLCAGTGGGRLKAITPSAQGTPELPKDLLGGIPSANILAELIAFLGRLLPDPRGRELAGSLRPPDPVLGAGLNLTLSRRRGKVFKEVTLWERDYGTLAPQGEKDPSQPPYDRLATPAAAWLQYASWNSTPWHGWKWLLVPDKWREPLSVLGTEEWQSYASFAVGSRAHFEGEWNTARLRYLDALGRDHGNRGATFNLAVAELQLSGDEDEYHMAACERLGELQDELEQEQDEDEDPLWYRVRNTQAVAWLDPDKAKGDPVKARKAAVSLCAALTAKLRDEKEPTEELKSFLESSQPVALILLASTLVRENRPATPTTIDSDQVADALDAFAHDRDNGGRKFDRTVTHPGLIDYVTEGRAKFGVDAAYNLACYYSRVGEAAEKAKTPTDVPWQKTKQYLRTAIELGGHGLGKWAKEDPALKAFRVGARNTWLTALVESRSDTNADSDPSSKAETESWFDHLMATLGKIASKVAELLGLGAGSASEDT